MNGRTDGAWFAPKLYGYGSGLPIAWQGWAVLAAYLASVAVAVVLIRWDDAVGRPAGYGLLAAATLVMIAVSKARTRGGWRWRWGAEE